MNSPTPKEWPLLIGLLLPWCLLGSALALGWITLQSRDWQQQQQLQLSQQVARQFSSASRWRSAQALQRSLAQIPHSAAWLEDDQRARVWQQGHSRATASGWRSWWSGPAPAQLRWSLEPGLRLVIRAPTMQRSQRHAWRLQLASALGLGLLFALLACALSYRWLSSRQRALLHWSRQLEQGALETVFRSGGLSGAVADNVSVLAKRLWYTRQTLNHYQPSGRSDQEGHLQQRIQALETQLGEQQTALDERKALVSSINHELRTPLTGISGFAELLAKSSLDPQQQEYVQAIRKSSSGMIRMISDFLDVERAEAGRLELHLGQLSVADVIEDTLALLSPLAYEKNLELLSIVDHDVPSPLQGDAARLGQILNNLVSNAIKFTDDGHVLIRVQLLDNDGEHVRLVLEVEDTGRGFSEMQKAQLFQAYQRFESDERRQVSGSGLGLRIVHQLTELLGGNISLVSAPERGTCFRVELPFTPLPAARSSGTWEALRQRRLWLADENEIARRALNHLLSYWRVDSKSFHSTTALLRELQAQAGASDPSAGKPELILLGLQSNAYPEDQLREISALAQRQGIAVLGLINSVDVQQHVALQQLGLDSVMPKSLPRSALYRTLGQALQGEQREQPALAGLQILLAENNTANQHYLSSMLQQLGANVICADDGEAALQAWQRDKPAFVLLDYNMPAANGEAVTRRIRAQDSEARTVIIGTSAHLSPREERAWFQAGLDSLLLKPFDENQFLRCIHPWLDTTVDEPGASGVTGAARLVDDPELAAMMAEELPKQMEELDQAFIQGDWEAARAAAHQLHGTAAFFHLEPLKSHVFLLETRLNKDDSPGDNPLLREDMAKVSADVSAILAKLTGA